MAEFSGTPGYGNFKEVGANDLGAHAIKGALDRAGIDAKDVDHVVMGNALQTAGDAIYGARHASLKAGLPIETPALTVNRICGSGIQSVVTAAQMIKLGEAKIAVGGGMENMSQAPHVLRGSRDGFRLGNSPTLEDSLMTALLDPYCGFYMAQTAENLAKKHDIPRGAQDEYALRSHVLGTKAVQSGLFKEEIVPLTVKVGRKEKVVDIDDHIKPDTSLEALSSLRPAFGKEGTVTAGNASGIVDAGAAIVIASASAAKDKGAKPIARIVGWGIAGVPPEIMGIGPVPAIRQVLERTGIKQDAIDRFEINEAFAAQYLACEKELGLDRNKCNVNGGAIGIGHPLGATGTRLILTLALELKRNKLKYGIASACIGGGQGIAILIENVS
jgi:acetyl-CoA acetyltransferase family protein